MVQPKTLDKQQSKCYYNAMGMRLKKTEFNKFFLRFNVIYLGFLFLCFVFTAAISTFITIEFGGPLYWQYGYYLIGVVLLLYLISIPSWVYALIKTWKLGASEHPSYKIRVVAIAYLLLAPVFLFWTGVYWVKMARLITDPLFF